MSRFRRRLLLMMQKVQEIWRDVVLTGTGVIVATDTTEGQRAKIFPQGWTKQDQYEGKNLFDATKDINVSYDGTVNTEYNTYIGNGSIEISAENLKQQFKGKQLGDFNGKTLCLSFTAREEKVAVVLFSNGTLAKQQNFEIGVRNTISFNVDSENYVVTFSKATYGSKNVVAENIMMNEGSTALPYEPYTGNKPSPSPEYPQPITNAGTYNEDTGKYEVEIELSGNFVDGSYVRATQNGVTFTMDHGKITVVGNGTANRLALKTKDFELNPGHYTVFIDKIVNFSVFVSASAASVVNIPAGSTKAEFDILEKQMINIGVTTAQGVDLNEEFYPMIVRGTEVVPYQPYTVPQTVTLTSDRPLTKWDRLVYMDGQWQWEYGGVIITSYNGESVIEPYYSTTGQLTTGAEVQYQTNAPTYTPIPEYEQQALNALKTYYPTTVFSNDQEGFMQVEYRTKYGNIVYIDDGFLDVNSSTASSKPTENQMYPYSYSTTKIPVKNGDVITVFYNGNYTSLNMRLKVYKEDESYLLGLETASNYFKISNTDARYARYMYLNSGNEKDVPYSITVTHSDGTNTEYKVVDRRSEA